LPKQGNAGAWKISFGYTSDVVLSKDCGFQHPYVAYQQAAYGLALQGMRKSVDPSYVFHVT
jgi:hypothetical protein